MRRRDAVTSSALTPNARSDRPASRISGNSKGVDALKLIAEKTEVAPDPFVTEANIRLIEEMDRRPVGDAQADALITQVQNRWFESRTASRGRSTSTTASLAAALRRRECEHHRTLATLRERSGDL